MNQNDYSSMPDAKNCSGCKKMFLIVDFYRRGVVWKTCNACSMKQTNKRKAETLGTEMARCQQAQTVWLGNGMMTVIEDTNTSPEIRDFVVEMEQSELREIGQMELSPFDFKQYAANKLQADYVDVMTGGKFEAEPIVSDSDAEMDVDEPFDIDSMTSEQVQVLMAFDSSNAHMDTNEPINVESMTCDQTPAKLKPLSLARFFASLNASQDLLRQPEPSELTGDDLVAHHISEFGLSVRLKALYLRWIGKNHDGHPHAKLDHFFAEVYAIHQMEVKHQCTPWAPLSGWLVIYEQEFNDFATDYELCEDVTWQAKRKYKARKLRLSRLLKKDLHDAVKEQIQSSKQDLRKLFVELTSRSDNEVKQALEVELQAVARAVKADCLNNGILFMDQDRFGKYKNAATK